MESMSNVPYYSKKSRTGARLGHYTLEDGILIDGLTDAFSNKHMGVCGDQCAKSFGITREDQDSFAIESYKRAEEATKNGYFKGELFSITWNDKKKGLISINEDEEYKNIKLDKVPKLNPAFGKEGTVTAANASKLSDGACALIIMSEEKAKRNNLRPLARILGFADAARDPEEFTTAPALAIPKALANAGVTKNNVDYWEINEAFSVVALANMKLLDIDHSRLNVFGGAVALGHPIGCSGARIIATLISVLNHKNASIGCASICNGGGGASAIVIEKL
jgi:acetyl-CoA C-acetyltransferase